MITTTANINRTLTLTAPDVGCCELYEWLRDELQQHVNIVVHKCDGHREHRHWFERDAAEVESRAVIVSFPPRVSIPAHVMGEKDRCAWEATLMEVSYAGASGYIATYSISGAA
jgi:hypothetical protein